MPLCYKSWTICLVRCEVLLIFLPNPHKITWDPAAHERRSGWGSEGASQHRAARTCPRTKTLTPVGAGRKWEVGGGIKEGPLCVESREAERRVWRLRRHAWWGKCLKALKRVCVFLVESYRGKWGSMCWAARKVTCVCCLHVAASPCSPGVHRGSIVMQLDLLAPLLPVSYLLFDVCEDSRPFCERVNIPAAHTLYACTYENTPVHRHTEKNTEERRGWGVKGRGEGRNNKRTRGKWSTSKHLLCIKGINLKPSRRRVTCREPNSRSMQA